MGINSTKLKVAVLMGGMSSEREISLLTGQAVLDALKRIGVDAVPVEADRDAVEKVKQAEVDIVFIALHGRYGEDGCVQGALELAGIPYTGSGVAASAIAMGKVLTKDICRAHSVPTPDYHLFSSNISEEELINIGVNMPIVVKPANGGSSIGITICEKQEQVFPAIIKAFEFDTEVLLEQFIRGPLITIGIVADTVLPAIEIEPKLGFYDYDNKYTAGATDYHIPAKVSRKIEQEAIEMTLTVHRALGCKGMSRSEVIVDGSDKCWFIEINTIPGMTETSLLPKAALQKGISFDGLVKMILQEALERDVEGING
ncbi:MAG: D-alanine--D-alanine ligase [Anaerolineales bacterium]|jgi:D-alanine-D-alanine ligase|nr:D-alanine--D-alanine ligase [Anaerolineales bacterium]